jgi:pimeloyl-ACP methyl ester carboxylesterase
MPGWRNYAGKFTGRYAHRLIPGAGHNLPQEAPQAFAAAVAEVGVLGQG